MMTGITGALHLPNFAFSEALADYHMCRAKQGSASAARGMQGVKQDFASSLHRQAMDRSKVDVKLVNAILMYPTVLSELVDAMREKVRELAGCSRIPCKTAFQMIMHGGHTFERIACHAKLHGLGSDNSIAM
jgi:hypothetical protein